MKTRILIVDDDAAFTHHVKRKLEAQGYFEVREEHDGLEALAAAREFGPDLVILDVMMPGIDGSDVAVRMKQDALLRDVPVLFMTALVCGREAPAGSCTSGGQTFLPKTIPLPTLIDCIERHTRAIVALSA